MLNLTLHRGNETVAIRKESHQCSIGGTRFEDLQCDMVYTIKAALEQPGQHLTGDGCVLRTSTIQTEKCGVLVVVLVHHCYEVIISLQVVIQDGLWELLY